MQLSIFTPVGVKGHAVRGEWGESACVELHEASEQNSAVSIHTPTAEALVKFGEAVAEEGWRLIRERTAKALHTPPETISDDAEYAEAARRAGLPPVDNSHLREVPAGCGDDAP